MAGHVPLVSCAGCMRVHLVTLLLEVVRLDFIVLECTPKLQSKPDAAAAAHALPIDMAFAIIGAPATSE